MRRADVFQGMAAACVLIAGCCWGATAVMAQTQSVQQVFEAYELIGTFAWDCGRGPASDNWYFVIRAIDANHVQRDRMVGPTTRDRVFITDRIEPRGPHEVAMTSTSDGERVD